MDPRGRINASQDSPDLNVVSRHAVQLFEKVCNPKGTARLCGLSGIRFFAPPGLLCLVSCVSPACHAILAHVLLMPPSAIRAKGLHT